MLNLVLVVISRNAIVDILNMTSKMSSVNPDCCVRRLQNKFKKRHNYHSRVAVSCLSLSFHFITFLLLFIS